MKHVKRIVKFLLIASLLLALSHCGKSCYDYATYTNTTEYELNEISDGIYGYYNSVVSNVPSENYEVITLYFNGQIHILNGDVNIHYTDGECKLIWTYRNIVHGDTIDIYVPYDSIEIRPTIVQS